VQKGWNMSARIDQELDYLRLLLNTNHTQQKSLINSISNQQIDALTEIFHNFLTLPLSSGESDFIQKRKYIIRKLSNISKSHRFRKHLILKHMRIVLSTLNFFKDQLNTKLGRDGKYDHS
jgi:hypothetical protein